MSACDVQLVILLLSVLLSCFWYLNVTSSNAPFSYLAGFDDFNLSLHSDMASVAKAMASPESGLEVRDRMWLKITIPNAFLGKKHLTLVEKHVSC